MPNGLSCGPREFTKLLKPALSHLHLRGHISSGYIDDLYLQGKTYKDYVHNVIDTVIQIDSLGLITHPDKSVFDPSQQLVILGFVLNSVTMTIKLTGEKALALQLACKALLNTASPAIREVARVLRKIAPLFPGLCMGPYTTATPSKTKLAPCATINGISAGTCLCHQGRNPSSSGG